jgi:hypothetical protein
MALGHPRPLEGGVNAYEEPFFLAGLKKTSHVQAKPPGAVLPPRKPVRSSSTFHPPKRGGLERNGAAGTGPWRDEEWGKQAADA